MVILFFIPNLKSGGAERVTSLLGNELSKRGHSVAIASNLRESIVYHIEPAVELINSSNRHSKNKIRNIYLNIRNYRHIIKAVNPDIIVAVMPLSFFITKIASIGLGIPIIASDHTSFDRKLPWHINFIRFHFYKLADKITILTKADFSYLGKRLPKKIVMPNPLAFPIIQGEVERERLILAVGRINEWRIKGFDILIEAWGRICHKYPEWRLEIVGEGDTQSFNILQSFAKEYNIPDQKILFSGFQSNVKELMQKSTIFIMPSRVEGFGLVLIEAMSQGCACISFDSNGRQKEIISTPESGILIEEYSAEKLSESLSELIENKPLQELLSSNAIKEMDKYSLSKITDSWELLIKNLTNGHNQ